ncbi:MAG TPA: hypothetical protein VMM18_02440 [Gemmatimonadaceae bacterium]|nr:hypothetical protein [Gemmatimonadaceae bacterium]
MQPSKNLALMFVLGAVLVGGVLGFSADRLLVQDRLCDTKSGQRPPRETLSMKLGLSDAQTATLDSLLDVRRRDMRAVLEPVRPTIDSVSANTNAQIRAMLAPAQQTKWDQLRREAQEREQARREKENQRN